MPGRTWPRRRTAILAALLTAALTCPQRAVAQQGDIFSSSSGQESCFVHSVTPLNTVRR